MDRRNRGIMVARKYSQQAVVARIVVCVLWFCLVGLSAGGCATTGNGNEQQASARKGASHAEQLYQAMLEVYAQRDLQVDIASEELLLVSSRYEKLGPELRRRYVSRVLALKAGIALNVTAEYQRGSEVDGEQRWRLIEDDDPLKAQAAREEVEIGRAVERVFHQRRK